ncbi:unnamed protein product [Caenorhabditis sp. 36 PRJEB53466]|nr:unnamed protein product [Caenorhabditis sp. 36 PRJEB53466]
MQVFVFDEHRYRELEPLNEVLVERDGSQMHPDPQFLVVGLGPDDEYSMKFRLELADEYRFSYQNDDWFPIAPAGVNAQLSRVFQLETQRELGATWHETIIRFEQLRLTRDLKNLGRNMVYVEPYHKYVPVLSVLHVSSGLSFDFRFDQLKFVAVKGYKSVQIRHMKRDSSRFFPLFVPSNYPPSEVTESLDPMTLQVLPYVYGEFFPPPPPSPQSHDFSCMPQSEVVQYMDPEQEAENEYEPEYGWNLILVPEKRTKEEMVTKKLDHEIWGPQEKELEKLYFQTEQDYHPLEMY